jgi:3-oxoacyl-[acyl-carrier protein] reductase
MNLSNRVAIVTGSGQGIGREIALALSEHGASIVISDINPTTAQETATEIQAKNGKRMSELDWDLVLATNLKGAFICTQAVLRHMIRQRWGRIINIASVVGLIGNAGQANYSAAKAGIIGLTKSTAREVASRGVTANAVAPGFIDTEMTKKLSDNVKQEFLRQIPLGYAGTPRDIAYAVAFLASEEAHYITGQVLNVDGGMVMM